MYLRELTVETIDASSQFTNEELKFHSPRSTSLIRQGVSNLPMRS